MTTLVIDTRSSEAKILLEYLKKQRFVRVVEGNTPNTETREAIAEIEAGKGKRAKTALSEAINDMNTGRVYKAKNANQMINDCLK